MSAISVFILVFVLTFVTYGGKSLVIYCYIILKMEIFSLLVTWGSEYCSSFLWLYELSARVNQFNFKMGNTSYSFFENVRVFMLWIGCVDGFYRDHFFH